MEGYDLPFYYQQLTVKAEVTTVDILTTNGHNASLYSCLCAKIPSAKPIIDGNGRCLSNCCSSSSRDLGIKIFEVPLHEHIIDNMILLQKSCLKSIFVIFLPEYNRMYKSFLR